MMPEYKDKPKTALTPVMLSEIVVPSTDDTTEKEAAQGRLARFSVLSFFLDILLLNASFIILNYYKRRYWLPEAQYINLWLTINVTWFMISLFYKKFHLKYYTSLKTGIYFISRTISSFLLLTAVTLIVLDLYAISRIQFFGTFMLYYFLNISFFLGLYYLRGHEFVQTMNGFLEKKPDSRGFSIRVFLADFLLMLGIFIVFHNIYHNSWILQTNCEKILVVLIGFWAAASFLTGKFEKRDYKNIYYAITPAIKAFMLMSGFAAIIILAMHFPMNDALLLLGSIVAFFAAELPLLTIYKSNKKAKIGDIETVSNLKAALRQEPLELEFFNKIDQIEEPATQLLKDSLQSWGNQPFNFITKHIDTDRIEKDETRIVNTRTRFNIRVFDNHSLTLLVNMHKVNDFRWINRYFLEAHRKIYNGGFLVGYAHTIHTHRKWMYEKFPFLIAHFLYPFDFIFRRVFPKLPVLKQIYFFLTRGRNRLISKAEVLGRLSFCGFKIIATDEFNNQLFFIAKRVKHPSTNQNPSYGPIIKLTRIGLDGKAISINKFRTMHPYSEYIQNYIYANHNLQESGKFNDDFRITEWGKWFRRLWIDELPQILNFIQGDISLVGVRALSRHYFDLYPDDLKQLRIQFKPGLVPPYYADMPQNFDEIVESERSYLLAKQKAPFTTDVKYFFKAFFNIIFRNARSQ
ncbi:MAG: hypothetical protein GF313_03815 [Caldithrix sp.]|nr:hypothetical protein [Caldithrix sp.]